MDPIDTNDEVTNRLRAQVSRLVYEYNESYSIHDFRMVSGTTHTNLIFDILVPSYDTTKHSFLRNAIQEIVFKEIGDNYYCVIQVDHSYID